MCLICAYLVGIISFILWYMSGIRRIRFYEHYERYKILEADNGRLQLRQLKAASSQPLVDLKDSSVSTQYYGFLAQLVMFYDLRNFATSLVLSSCIRSQHYKRMWQFVLVVISFGTIYIVFVYPVLILLLGILEYEPLVYFIVLRFVLLLIGAFIMRPDLSNHVRKMSQL